MRPNRCPLTPLTAALLLVSAGGALAQQASPANSANSAGTTGTLSTVTVNASADASAAGLTKPYAGGQVARGGRVGILGNQDNMDTPFAITSYTNELIQNQQARSVGDVLRNDPSVRLARGFGNFQESYFIRGFILGSDFMAYNGLYSLLPRQYISSELFERVEVLHGASAFLTGATPGNGDGVGGVINLLPKRAPNEPLTDVTVGMASGSQAYVAADIARRFGPDQATGIRLNIAHRNGGTGVDNERMGLDVASVGLDWRGRDLRLSADLGHQEHRLERTRTNVTLASTAGVVPRAPDSSTNWAQPGSYSNERDTFGTLRGEYDITPDTTGWFALGARRGVEANSLGNLTVANGATGAGTTYRFDNTGVEKIKTGELGLRGKLATGSVKHNWVASYAYFDYERANAYTFDFANTQSTNLYNPVYTTLPAFSAAAGSGNDLAYPAVTSRKRLTSVALGDTLGFLDNTLLLTLGVRHQSLDLKSYKYGTGVLDTNYDQSRTSPAGGAVFKLSKQVSLYGNYIEGLSPGETAPAQSGGLPVANAGQMLAPYVSKQKEIGVKYDGGRLGGSIAFFDIERPRSLRDPSTGIFSAQGKDQHRGIEFNVHGEPVRGLRVLGGLTFLEAEQKSTGSATTDGKRVIGVPKQQGSFGVEWDVPGVRGLALNARAVATGSSYADAINTLRVPGYGVLDIGARYTTEFQGQLVTLRARVDNVADRNYWSSVGGYPNAGYLVLGAPRTLNVSATFSF